MQRWRIGFLAACLLTVSTASNAATLDVPAAHSTVSGIGVIHGWKCDVHGTLTVRLDGGTPLPLAYGNARGDTAGVCGDINNGFVSIFNWGILSNGTHTAVVYDDGVEFDRSIFTVKSFRDPFVTNAFATVSVENFPNQGETAVFSWSQATQHLELADAFGAPAENDPADCEGWTTGPIHPDDRTYYGSAEWVQACLDAGADPNARDVDGSTPLHHIADTRSPDRGRMASLLLAAGADPNARNDRGKTPLHSTASEFEFTVVLLEAGADPNARDEYGTTLLHRLASSHDNTETGDAERALVRAGADPNLLDERGEPYSCRTFECMAKKTYRMSRP